MLNTLDNVYFYTELKGEIHVYFPNGKEVCQYCKYIKSNSDLKRFKCILTEEYIINPFSERGHFCPLNKEEQINE